LIICPGNEAGDAASCNSVALNDRGAKAEVAGVTSDNATLVLQLVADTTSTNDFVALKGHAGGVLASDITVSTTKTTAATESRDASPLASTALASRTFATSKYYVATIGASADNVTYAAISGGAIGTAVDIGSTISGSRTAVNDLKLADGGSTTMMMVGESDNVSIYIVGASGLTLWNDNTTGIGNGGSTGLNMWAADNDTSTVSTAFAVSPNGDRAVLVGFYDNKTSDPIVAAFSPTALDIANSSDNNSYRISGGFSIAANDNDTGFDNATINPQAQAAWCDDGSSGGALWLAISADNNSGFTLSKWTDNATVGAAYFGLFSLNEVSSEGADNSSSDNITSLSMACDPDDSMPVLAVGYDSTISTGGDLALAKFDNNTDTWEKLLNASNVGTVNDPVTVATSSDGSVFALGFNNIANDNASIVIFYDE